MALFASGCCRGWNTSAQADCTHLPSSGAFSPSAPSSFSGSPWTAAVCHPPPGLLLCSERELAKNSLCLVNNSTSSFLNLSGFYKGGRMRTGPPSSASPAVKIKCSLQQAWERMAAIFRFYYFKKNIDQFLIILY